MAKIKLTEAQRNALVHVSDDRVFLQFVPGDLSDRYWLRNGGAPVEQQHTATYNALREKGLIETVNEGEYTAEVRITEKGSKLLHD